MAGKRPPVTAAAEQRRLSDELRSLRAQLAVQSRDLSAGGAQNLRAELEEIREAIARNKRDLGGLIGDGKDRRMARAADELSAARRGMEIGAEKILKAVEVIDESARALTASLQDEYKRGLAQEVQDQVIDVFEACNFQDIAGQRIDKVIATLSTIEQQVAAALARCETVAPALVAPARPGNGLINGPKIEGDLGHASQRDIDKMFGT